MTSGTIRLRNATLKKLNHIIPSIRSNECSKICLISLDYICTNVEFRQFWVKISKKLVNCKNLFDRPVTRISTSKVTQKVKGVKKFLLVL